MKSTIHTVTCTTFSLKFIEFVFLSLSLALSFPTIIDNNRNRFVDLLLVFVRGHGVRKTRRDKVRVQRVNWSKRHFGGKMREDEKKNFAINLKKFRNQSHSLSPITFKGLAFLICFVSIQILGILFLEFFFLGRIFTFFSLSPPPLCMRV